MRNFSIFLLAILMTIALAREVPESLAKLEVRGQKFEPDAITKLIDSLMGKVHDYMEGAKTKVQTGIDNFLGTMPGMAEKLFTEYGSSVRKTAEGWTNMAKGIATKVDMPEKGEKVEAALEEMAKCVETKLAEITPIVKELMEEYRKRNAESYKKDEPAQKPTPPSA